MRNTRKSGRKKATCATREPQSPAIHPARSEIQPRRNPATPKQIAAAMAHGSPGSAILDAMSELLEVGGHERHAEHRDPRPRRARARSGVRRARASRARRRPRRNRRRSARRRRPAPARAPCSGSCTRTRPKAPFSTTSQISARRGSRDSPVATSTAVMNNADSSWPAITALTDPIRRPASAPKKSARPHPRAATSPKIIRRRRGTAASRHAMRGLEPLFRRDPAEFVARGEVRGLDHHIELGVRRHRLAEPGHVPRPIHGALRRLHHERLVLRDLLGEPQRGVVQLLSRDDPIDEPDDEAPLRR